MESFSQVRTAAVAEDSEAKDAMKDIELGEVGNGAAGEAGLTALAGAGSTYTLECHDIAYSINIKKDKVSQTKQLIKPINFKVRPREMLAIMGASGAGKSTLLDILAGRITPKATEGEYLINDKPVSSSFKRISGYVMQDDALYPLLTVRQTLRYAAQLRIPNMSKEEKWKIVEETIKVLKLTGCADTIVGDADHRGVSGGEKRRVSIGVDIVHQPAIVFLDEPTSGLDSTTALQITQTLREICMRDRTVAMTIHQPSMRVVECFHKVLFLSQGYMVFWESPDALPAWLKSVNPRGGELPKYVNLAELFLEVVDDYESKGTVAQLAQQRTDAHRQRRQSSSMIAQDVDIPDSAYANGLLAEVRILLNRNLRNVVKTPELFFVRVGLSIVMALVLGSLFWQVSKQENGIRKRVSYFAFLVAFYLFTSLEALPIFLNERSIFMREHSRGAYRIISYVLANAVVYLPFFITMAVVFNLISYFMVGLVPTAGNWLFQTLITFIILYVGNGFATLLSAVVPDALTGNGAGTAVFSFMFLFSGFFIPTKQIPIGWRWFHYLSMFSYPYESLAKNELEGINAPSAQKIAWETEYSVEGVSRWRGVWCSIIFAVAWRALFYLALKLKHRGGRT